MAVSVPKRLFKRAVDRNLLKRRIREAYRLNKQAIYDVMHQKNIKLHLVIQYQQKDINDFHSIEAGIKKGLALITEHIKNRISISE